MQIACTVIVEGVDLDLFVGGCLDVRETRHLIVRFELRGVQVTGVIDIGVEWMQLILVDCLMDLHQCAIELRLILGFLGMLDWSLLRHLFRCRS